jgi:hypothetical protein
VRNHTRAWSTIAGGLATADSVATLGTPAAQAMPRGDLFAISGAPAPQTANVSPELRVDQVGYSDSAAKVACLMAVSPLAFSLGGSRVG